MVLIGLGYRPDTMVGIAQLVARQIVALKVQGSSPCTHPLFLGLSPSGKAQHFDCCITVVRIHLAQLCDA